MKFLCCLPNIHYFFIPLAAIDTSSIQTNTSLITDCVGDGSAQDVRYGVSPLNHREEYVCGYCSGHQDIVQVAIGACHAFLCDGYGDILVGY